MLIEGWGSEASIWHTYLNLVPFDANFERLDFEFTCRVVEPTAVFDAEPPGVPRAGDAISFEITLGERRALVGATIVDRRVFAADIKHGDNDAVHFIGTAFPFGNVAGPGDGLKLGHRQMSGDQRIGN